MLTIVKEGPRSCGQVGAVSGQWYSGALQSAKQHVSQRGSKQAKQAFQVLGRTNHEVRVATCGCFSASCRSRNRQRCAYLPAPSTISLTSPTVLSHINALLFGGLVGCKRTGWEQVIQLRLLMEVVHHVFVLSRHQFIAVTGSHAGDATAGFNSNRRFLEARRNLESKRRFAHRSVAFFLRLFQTAPVCCKKACVLSI